VLLGRLCTRSRLSRSKAQRANLSDSGAKFRSLASRERERRHFHPSVRLPSIATNGSDLTTTLRASKLRDAFRAREPFGSGETLCRASLGLAAPTLPRCQRGEHGGNRPKLHGSP